METINYGYSPELELQHQTPDDWLAGADSVSSIITIPEGERDIYLPEGELQNIGEEKFDCVSRAIHNKLEIDFDYALKLHLFTPENEKWFLDNGYLEHGKPAFSDAFTAILSNTTRQGNSLKAPLDSVHRNGLVPKVKLPQLDTFDAHHNPARITNDLRVLGLEFLKRFTVNYERANELQFGDILQQKEALCVGGFAWPVPINGEYPKVQMYPNHAFLIYKTPKYHAFDNYEEAKGDFIKKLAPDYDFVDTGYRVFVSAERKPLTHAQKKTLWQLIISFLWKEPEEIKRLEPILDPDFVSPKTRPVTETKPKTPRERLKEICLESLGKDLSIQAPNELGCSEALSTVLRGVFPDFPSFISTRALWEHLRVDKRFKNTKLLKPWSVIISPTGQGNGTLKNGHAGVYGENEIIYSNNSKTGKWDSHWKLGEWAKYYRDKGGFPILIYEV